MGRCFTVKASMRKEVTQKRDSLSRKDIFEKSRSIKSKLFKLPEFIKSDTVSFFVNFKSEVETVNMIEESIKMGKRVIVPVVVSGQKDLLLSELKSLDELYPSKFGILEPESMFIRPVDEREIEVLITPGVAFDEEGFRIGYGGGYYDRLIKKLPDRCKTIALAFEIQMVDRVPREEHDMKVHMIITEDRIITTDSEGETP